MPTAPTTEPSTLLPHPAVDEFVLTEVLAALADPIRLEMVKGLHESGVERTCSSFALPIAKSTASHHWKTLREAGVVYAREEGTKKYHGLRTADLEARFPGLLESVVRGSGSD